MVLQIGTLNLTFADPSSCVGNTTFASLPASNVPLHPGWMKRSGLSSGFLRTDGWGAIRRTIVLHGDTWSMNPPGPEDSLLMTDERAAARAFVARCEVRLSTFHRIAVGMLSGAGLLVVLPVVAMSDAARACSA